MYVNFRHLKGIIRNHLNCRTLGDDATAKKFTDGSTRDCETNASQSRSINLEALVAGIEVAASDLGNWLIRENRNKDFIRTLSDDATPKKLSNGSTRE
ncbi:hypothetical protein C5167_029076, partial [Papaver somniferum]